MYIMVKTYQNLELLARDVVHELSILESRNTTKPTLRMAKDYNSRSTPKRMASAAKLVQFQRGLRKSSSLTNGMSPAETKLGLESMAKKARGLLSKHLLPPSMRPSWAPSLMRSV